MKTKPALLLVCLSVCFVFMLGSDTTSYAERNEDIDPATVYGRIEYVTHGADVKVRVVESFADLKVLIVQGFADSPGEWEIVEHGADFKVEIVTAFEDFTIEYVKAFPGVR